MATKAKKLGDLDATNYREWAQACIDKYEKANRPVDAIVWSQIVGYYEAALAAAATPYAKDGGAE